MLKRIVSAALILIFIPSAIACSYKKEPERSANGDYMNDSIVLFPDDIKERIKSMEKPCASASGAYLYVPDADICLISENADTPLPMASTTKIMTGLIACERLKGDDVITVDERAVGVEGSSAYLMKGEKISVETLLYALLLQSANDAATELAILVSGSVGEFSALMNSRAKELGLSNTHFTNPHGLDDEEHYTSARDLAILTARAMENPLFKEIVGTKTYRTPAGETPRCFTNHNRLLFTYKGAVGVKTGYTIRTGRCLVSAAERDGMMLIAVTLHDKNDWNDHKKLLDWGFEKFKISLLSEKKSLNLTLPISGSDKNEIPINSKENARVFTYKDTNIISERIEAPHFLVGKISKGDVVGTAVFTLRTKDGEESEISLPLISGESAEMKKSRNIIERIKDRIKEFIGR